MLFIHIPKTGGTSFRKAAEEFYGAEHVLYDYGERSSETSDLVTKFCYKEKDLFLFGNQFLESGAAFLGGHFHAAKYVRLFGIRNTVVFLRHPCMRMISEYSHFRRNHGYVESIDKFLSEPRFINRQIRLMSNIPLNALGFIGLQERYNESIVQYNNRYGAKLSKLSLNMGGETSSISTSSQNEKSIKNFEKINQLDFKYYGKAVELFEHRTQQMNKNVPFVHGDLQIVTQNQITGWAWWDCGDSAVTVELRQRDRTIAESIARDLRPGLLWLSPPRRGYVGFQFLLGNTIPHGERVSVYVKQTGQLIASATVLLAENT